MENKLTAEEAIEILENIKSKKAAISKQGKALTMAIEALQSQPPTVTHDADYISNIIKSDAAEMYWRYPTVTDEEIESEILRVYGEDPHLFACQRDGFRYCIKWMRNKLTPNK